MKKFLRNNFLIIIAFLLPIVFITVTVLNTYLRTLNLSSYNFIYVSCTKRDINDSYIYACIQDMKKRYGVKNGKISVNTNDNLNSLNYYDYNDYNPVNTQQNFAVSVFLHDTNKNVSKKISLEQAQNFTLDDSVTSPDGVTVSNMYNRTDTSFFIISTSPPRGDYYYLIKGNSMKKLNLAYEDQDYYRYQNFKFIGWIIPE